MLDDRTLRKDVVVILASVLKQQFYGSCELGLLDDLVLRLCADTSEQQEEDTDEI